MTIEEIIKDSFIVSYLAVGLTRAEIISLGLFCMIGADKYRLESDRFQITLG